MKCNDGKDVINVLKLKEKDYEAWKKELPYSNLKSENRLLLEYGWHLENEKELKENGVNEKKKCPICKNEAETGKVVSPDKEYLEYYCDKCILIKEEEDKRIEEEVVAKKKQEAKDQRKIDYMCSVPLRYSGNEIKETTNEKFIKSVCSILFGGFGTGKTWAAYSLIKKLYCNLYIDTYEMITEAGLINYLKSGFNDNSFEDRLNKFKESDLLIVDEMGKSNDSDFNKAQLFEILNYRYDWMKKTVLICNCLDKSELPDILNPAIADRYRECIIKMDGDSKRYKKA